MDLMKLGTQLLAQKLGSNASSDMISSALGALLKQQNSQQANQLSNQQRSQRGSGASLLGGLVASLSQQGGLENAVQSWLGDGNNDTISSNQLEQALGSDQLSNFASQLGIDQQTASQGLAEALPQMIDKSSRGGNLLDNVDGIGGALHIAKQLFR